MGSQLRIGVAGCGSISQHGVLPHLSQRDVAAWLELTAVCDIVAERAAKCAKHFGVPQHYADYGKMLSEAGLDAVVIASPIRCHYEQGMAAIRSGKHVYFNKTMTTTAREAQDIIKAGRAAGVKLVASPGMAFSSVCRFMRQQVAAGVIGQPFWAICSACWVGHEDEKYWKTGAIVDPVDQRWYYERGGGPLYDIAVYQLHMLTHIFGPAKRVTALSGIALAHRDTPQGRVTVTADDNTLLGIDFGDNRFVAVTSAWCHGGVPFTIGGAKGQIKCEQGKVVVNDVPMAIGAAFKDVEGKTYRVKEHQAMPENHVFEDIMHLVFCIANDWEPSVATVEEAAHVIEIIDKGYVAAKTGQTQRLETTF